MVERIQRNVEPQPRTLMPAEQMKLFAGLAVQPFLAAAVAFVSFPFVLLDRTGRTLAGGFPADPADAAVSVAFAAGFVAAVVTLVGVLPTALWVVKRRRLTLTQAFGFGIAFADVPVLLGTVLTGGGYGPAGVLRGLMFASRHRCNRGGCVLGDRNSGGETSVACADIKPLSARIPLRKKNPHASCPSRSGRPQSPWKPARGSIRGRAAELPVPPAPTGLGWLAVVGPGVIVLGASIGGGEFLLGPAAFVRHGLSLLWVTGIAVWLQTVFNTELMRYTLATGEPVFTGFMRTRPSADALGVGLRHPLLPADRLARIGGERRRGDLLPLRAAARRAGGRCQRVLHRRRDIPRVRGRAPGRATHRAHARAAQLGARHLHPGQLPHPGACSTCRPPPGSRRRWGSRGSTPTTGSFDFLPAGTDFVLLAALVALLRGRGRRQHRPLELGTR